MKMKSFVAGVKKYKNAYLFIAPFFILYAVFGIYPILYSLAMSFYKYTPAKGFIEFVGMKNYMNVFNDAAFWKALLNTIWFMIFNVPILIFCALGVAALFNNPRIRFRKAFQLIYLLPYVTSSIAYGIVFLVLFDERIGLVNQVLLSLGFRRIGWLTSPSWTKITVDIVLIWAWLGYNMLIMLGGLQNINADLYDAAKMDGATGWKSFLHITIPLMKPIVIFTMISSTIGTFNMFNEPFILLGPGGGPSYSGFTLNMYLYSRTFTNFQLSQGAAISFTMFILIILFSIPQIRNSFRSNV